ncbi:MAG: vanadium-dependent haloperoxidase [Verrucomicrobiales bacterium]
MVRTSPLIAVLVALLPAAVFAAQRDNKTPEKTIANEWLDIALEATARDVDRYGARPTVLSRTLAIPMTAMFDAWAAYDEKAAGTRLGTSLRRPLSERTIENKKKAISYAVYRTLVDVYPHDAAYAAEQLTRLGYNPNDVSMDPSTPQGIGNTVAAALIAYRHHDGANQLGDEAGSEGKAYSDYTYYRPINPPDKIIDPDRWQPIAFDDGKGGKVTPGFLTPHWYRVKPFALKSSDQFRPGPPPLVGSEQLLNETKECIDCNAKLDPKVKAIVEFMRDGPRSTGQSGHWLKFAQMVSRRDKHDLDKDVKLYFAIANVAMDAFIASWETKRYYDSSRPWTLVRHYFRGQEIQCWGGPGKGACKMKGEGWHPYSPSTFITPPFPGYVSGHSTVSAACAETLKLFTGSDHFGEVEVRKCCILTEPVAGEEVKLDLPTFTATAEMAGISRVYGGYHIQADNIEGLTLGRKVATYDWPKIRGYFEGTARPVIASATAARQPGSN